VPSELQLRAAIHAALGDPVRLAIVDGLITSDRSPGELATRFELPGNLLAHHLDRLEHAGLIERFRSAGDQRCRYVRLVPGSLAAMVDPVRTRPTRVAFVCTRNSARSQLAAALWEQRTGQRAASAGTDPAERVHAGAVNAARRHGLDLASAVPRRLGDVDDGVLIVTVCDHAREQLGPSFERWHWSIPDPVPVDTVEAFDDVVARLDTRIRTLI
jgi:protein-tyrosine-phosphatase/DNA-binding transcriptional ArsR family regulator